MIRILRNLSVALLLSHCPLMHMPASASDDVEPDISAATFNELDQRIEDWVGTGNPVGAELLVMHGDQTIFHKAYGWSDRAEKKAMNVGSIFRIRSMTKPILGTAVLMLRDEGRFALDDPVSRYLPAFDNDNHSQITIRELLSHTSGMGDHGFGDIGLPKPPGEFESLSALVHAIAKTNTNGPRGRFLYSDSNSAILGALVAEISGMPAEDFLKQRIFDPLGMKDSHLFFSPEFAWAARMNSTFRLNRETCDFERYWDPTQAQSFPYFRASGGVYSTTLDYARFLALWMDGGVFNGRRLLSNESMGQALHRYSVRDSERGYGLHWTIFGDVDQTGQAQVFGHSGSDGTLALAFPDRNARILFFTQSRGSNVGKKFKDALRQTAGFDHFPRTWRPELRSDLEAVKAAGSAVDPNDYDRFVGSYEDPGTDGARRLEIRRSDDGFVADLSNEDTVPLFPTPAGFLIGEIHSCESLAVQATLSDAQPGSGTILVIRLENGFEARFVKTVTSTDR